MLFGFQAADDVTTPLREITAAGNYPIKALKLHVALRMSTILLEALRAQCVGRRAEPGAPHPHGVRPNSPTRRVRTAAADARAAHETAKAERTISEFSALAEERAKPWWRRIVG